LLIHNFSNRARKLVLGSKLVVSHAGLVGPDFAAHPLEPNTGHRLLIGYNASKPAPWHVKLGMQRDPALAKKLRCLKFQGQWLVVGLRD